MGLMGSLFFGIGKGSGCLFGKHETIRQTLWTKLFNIFLPFTLEHLSYFSWVILIFILYHPLKACAYLNNLKVYNILWIYYHVQVNTDLKDLVEHAQKFWPKKAKVWYDLWNLTLPENGMTPKK